MISSHVTPLEGQQPQDTSEVSEFNPKRVIELRGYVRVSRAIKEPCLLCLSYSQYCMIAAMLRSCLHSSTMLLPQQGPSDLHLIHTLRWWARLRDPHRPLVSRGTLPALGLSISFFAERKPIHQDISLCLSLLSHSKRSRDECPDLGLLARSLLRVTLWPCSFLAEALPDNLEDREPIAE